MMMIMKTAGGGRCEKKTLKGLRTGGRIKPENEKIDYIVDAVGAEKKISFSCFRFNGRKQQKLKNSGAEYACSPWTPVWNERERSGTTDKEALL